MAWLVLAVRLLLLLLLQTTILVGGGGWSWADGCMCDGFGGSGEGVRAE